MPHTRQPYYHGRFREDRMGQDRWAVLFYSFTGGTQVLVVDHLSSKEDAVDIRDALNDESGITEFINKRKESQR